MVHRIVWAEAAKQDLREFLDHLSHSSPRAALAYVKGIRSTAAKLADFPNAGRRYDDKFRAVVHRNHVILYSVDGAAKSEASRE